MSCILLQVMLMLESCDYSLKDWCDSQRFEVATGADYILECLRCARLCAPSARWLNDGPSTMVH